MTKDKKPTEVSDEALEKAQGGLLDYDWIAKSKAPKPGAKGDSFYEAGDLNNFTAPGDVAGVKGK